MKENIREAYAPQAKPSPDPAPQMAPMPPKAAKPSSKTYPYALDNDKSPSFSDEQKIERQLLKMNMEKQFLESQYAKMDAGILWQDACPEKAEEGNRGQAHKTKQGDQLVQTDFEKAAAGSREVISCKLHWYTRCPLVHS